MSKVIILGAKGRFGRAALHAFAQAGWQVTALGRNWGDATIPGVARITGNAFDAETLKQACAGHDVIVNALNPPYENWSKDLPRLTASVIKAAKASGATVIIPGNVYNYGETAPAVLTEDTPWHPTTRKGKLRVDMENTYRASGVRTIVLRAGDFIEQEQSGNWFDAKIAADARKGRTVYPGPHDAVHAWAYLPDMARAAVMLAEKRAQFDAFEEVGFEGYSLNGQELAAHIAAAVGRPQRMGGLPWKIVGLLGLFNAGMREIYEMRSGRCPTGWMVESSPTCCRSSVQRQSTARSKMCSHRRIELEVQRTFLLSLLELSCNAARIWGGPSWRTNKSPC
jgi:nucleoside-diphosphate-sugar epimerase